MCAKMGYAPYVIVIVILTVTLAVGELTVYVDKRRCNVWHFTLRDNRFVPNRVNAKRIVVLPKRGVNRQSKSIAVKNS
jgi:hypothetical protein